MRQKSDTAGPRPMKTLLVASLIASQCITNVVAFPIPSQSQSGNDSVSVSLFPFLSQITDCLLRIGSGKAQQTGRSGSQSKPSEFYSH